MSRHRLRGGVTPPTSLLGDESDSDVDMVDGMPHGSTIQTHQNQSTSYVSANIQRADVEIFQTDHLQFDSDEDLGSGDMATPRNQNHKQLLDEENLNIQHSARRSGIMYITNLRFIPFSRLLLLNQFFVHC